MGFLALPVRRGERSNARRDALASSARIGRTAAAVLPAFAVVRSVAAAADDNLARQAVTADAAAGLFYQLRLLADDKFNAGCGDQIELVRQRTGSFDEGL